MTRLALETLINLKNNFSESAMELFYKYRELRQRMLGDGELAPVYNNGRFDYIFVETSFEDCFPDGVYENNGRKEFIELVLEHSKLKYECFLGYESAYKKCELPIKWLFDSEWEREATDLIERELNIRISIKHNSELKKEMLEKQQLEYLKKKYEIPTNN